MKSAQPLLWSIILLTIVCSTAPGNCDEIIKPIQSIVDCAPAAQTVPESGVNSALPIKYLGNSFSMKFHRPSCKFAKAMNSSHVVFFNWRRQAIESGQVPCRYCLPASWTSVKAVILKEQKHGQDNFKSTKVSP